MTTFNNIVAHVLDKLKSTADISYRPQLDLKIVIEQKSLDRLLLREFQRFILQKLPDNTVKELTLGDLPNELLQV